MTTKRFIDNVRVASPCTEDWDKMRGNDRVRMCDHCVKEVNNLSELTRKQAKQLVRSSDGNICIRYFEHPVTKAPLFSAQLHQITRRTGIAAGVVGASMSLATLTYAQGSPEPLNSSNFDKKALAAARAGTETKKDTKSETNSGNLGGVITDPNGAVIPGAVLKFTNDETKDVITMTTSSEGEYYRSALPAGNYTINVNASGFKPSVISAVTVKGGETTVVDVTLELHQLVVLSGVIGVSRDYSTDLGRAVDNDDIDEVRTLLANGANVNEKDKDYDNITPLFIAVENGNVEIAKLLIASGAKVNVRNSEKQTALMQMDGDATAEMVNLLIGAGAKVNLLDDEGNTSLILAAENCSTEVLKALIDAGADVNLGNKEGVTPLMNAADKGDIESVRLILNSGAMVNARDEDGDNAWEYADEKEIEDLLVSYGSETRFIEPEGNYEDEEKPNEQPKPVINF
ncbi:MAG TPA: ankyrin repeat domain-containing protein [Pyrinomonadaceae bacterium]|nr:ankyrin repeat domain-containing protein [Pyrinomonadaceae bacterium]